MVTRADLGIREVKIAVDHFETGMPQDLFEREDVTTGHQVADGESVAAEMSVQSSDAGSSGQAGKHELQRIYGQWFPATGQEQVVAGIRID